MNTNQHTIVTNYYLHIGGNPVIVTAKATRNTRLRLQAGCFSSASIQNRNCNMMAVPIAEWSKHCILTVHYLSSLSNAADTNLKVNRFPSKN